MLRHHHFYSAIVAMNKKELYLKGRVCVSSGQGHVSLCDKSKQLLFSEVICQNMGFGMDKGKAQMAGSLCFESDRQGFCSTSPARSIRICTGITLSFLDGKRDLLTMPDSHGKRMGLAVNNFEHSC